LSQLLKLLVTNCPPSPTHPVVLRVFFGLDWIPLST
jgi:hypothetical protein